PDRVRKFEVRIIRFEQQLRQAGVDSTGLTTPKSAASILIQVIKRSLVFLLLLGRAAFGIVVHFPAYRLGGLLSSSLFRSTEDVVSTIKIISAMLFFPLTWLVLTVIALRLWGWWAV